VAVYEFAANPNAEKAFSSKVVERIGVVSLRKQVEHMGLTGTVSYLLPIIVPEALLPVDVLTGCQNAIAQRQNVVHNGQRDVSAQVLRVSLNSIRKLCTILEQLTLPTPIVPAGKPL